MAEGDGFIYNNFKEQVMEAEFNLATAGDVLKLILVSGHTPNIDTHTIKGDVVADEYSTATGYTAGGETLAGSIRQERRTRRTGFARMIKKMKFFFVYIFPKMSFINVLMIFSVNFFLDE